LVFLVLGFVSFLLFLVSFSYSLIYYYFLIFQYSNLAALVNGCRWPTHSIKMLALGNNSRGFKIPVRLRMSIRFQADSGDNTTIFTCLWL
jgi:hypothetical protein